MRPEDVPADLVEKAALAVTEVMACGCCNGSCADCIASARAALAAVLPEVQVQALEHLADLLSADEPTNTGLIGPIGLQDLANDLRAGTLTARLTATNERNTDV